MDKGRRPTSGPLQSVGDRQEDNLGLGERISPGGRIAALYGPLVGGVADLRQPRDERLGRAVTGRSSDEGEPAGPAR